MPAYQESPSVLGALGWAGRKTLSGLAAGANFLDIPSSMVRDTITLNNPVNQLIPTNWFSGGGKEMPGYRDVFRNYGLASQENNWRNFGVGLAADIAFDPLNAVTFGGAGALRGVATPAGQVAAKAGVLEDALRAATHASDARLPTMGPRQAMASLTPRMIETAIPGAGQRMAEAALSMGVDYGQLADAPVGGFMGLATQKLGSAKLPKPFGAPDTFLGTGANTPLMPLMKTLDRVENTMRWSGPGRTLSALFNPAVKGLGTRTGQETAERVTAATDRLVAGTREAVAPHIRTFQEAGVFDDAAKEEAVWKALEGVGVRTNDVLTGRKQRPYQFSPGQFRNAAGDDVTPGMQAAVNSIRGAMKGLLEQEQSAGLSTELLDDMLIDYMARAPQFLSGPWSKGYKGSRRVLPVSHPFQSQRDEAVRNIAGGTATLNKLSLDPAFSGISHAIATDQLTKQFWEGKALELQQSPLFAEIFPGAGQKPLPKRIADEGFGDHMSEERLLKLVKWAGNLDPEHVRQQIPVYQSPIVSFMKRMEYGQKAIAGADTVFSVLRQGAKDVADPGDIALGDVLRGSGLGPRAIARMDDMLKSSGSNLTTKTAWIPKDLAADAGRLMKPFTNPDEVKWLVENVIDPYTALWKGTHTNVWPSFHVRNFSSGQIQNYLAGAYKSVRSGASAVSDMDGMLRGNAVADAAKLVGDPSLSPEDATKRLADLMFREGLLGKQGMFQDVVSPTGPGGRRPAVASDIPGLFPAASTPWQSVKAGLGRITGSTWSDWNPLNQRGVATTENKFLPAAIGDDIGQHVEALNRGAPFIDLLRQGFSPEQAAKRVKDMQADYSQLTQFEQAFARRAMPFYSFSQAMAGFVAEELMQRPGGMLSQSLRATEALRGDQPGIPDYISQGAAINLGGLPDGSQRYITGLGLMHEDPLSLGSIRNGFPSGQDTLAELVSRTNPLLKLPIELAAGESFFQRGPMGGRDLADLDPTVGRIFANLGLSSELPSGRARPFISNTAEHLLANSPLSRLLSTIRTVSDPRKREGSVPGAALMARLATGVGVSDVSPAASDAVVRDELFNQIRESGGSVFERAFFKKDAALTKEQQAYADLAKVLGERAKARAQAKTQE